MKLRTKIFALTGLLWIFFLAVTVLLGYKILSAALSPIFLISYFLIGTAVLLLLNWLLDIVIFKRLDQMTQHLNLDDQTDTDEFSLISQKIDALQNSVASPHPNLTSSEIHEHQSVEKELTMHKEHLVRLAHYDHLTALPNRVFFNEILNKALSHANRHNKILAILFIDLDHFKKINDVIGHLKGDLVLKEIADRFSMVLRTGDILARLGGDEFIILLNDIHQAKFSSFVAEKILEICATPISFEKHEFFISASIGICCFPDDGASLEDLQKHADMAMYKAKHSGGNTYQYFTNDMTIKAHEYLKLESALRKAISNHEFVLYFQPKLNLEDGLICGVEALIRWENADIGIISPSKFIPLAEETGLILQIGEWVLREACRINKHWQDQGFQPLSIAVNISPKQFKHQNMAELVAKVLRETGLDPQYLELEITENVMMDDMESAVTLLNEIREMGVQIAIDDFGTGYTSINYLKQLPISVLKIDQNFVKGIPQNQDDNAITTAVIALGHSLGFKVIAEGVETAEQLQFLADLGCDIVQGYFLSRPLPEGKVVLQFARLEVVKHQ